MNKELRIAFVGDVMCGDSFFCMGSGTGSQLSRFGVEFLDSEMREFLGKFDMVVCNVESVLSDIGKNENRLRSMHMRGRAQVADYLFGWNIKLANLANNHILEQGRPAARDTAVQLEKRGISTIGAGKDSCFDKGLQVANFGEANQELAFMGICLRKEKYAYSGGGTLQEVIERTRELAAAGKTVIVSVHWGDEWMNRPSVEQKGVARNLVRAGARLIAGHHPHVVQGIEEIGESLVVYSLGNFIFNTIQIDSKWSMILDVKFRDGRIVRWDTVPIEMDNFYRPHIVSGSVRRELRARIENRNHLAGIPILKAEQQGTYLNEFEELNQAARKRIWKNLIRKSGSLSPIYWPQILWRPVQRKLNIW